MSYNDVNMRSLEESSSLLIWHGSPLKRAVLSIGERSIRLDPPFQKLSRVISKIGVALVSMSAKIFFVPIALKLGKIAGPVSAFGNTGSFFLLEWWAGKNVVNEYLGPLTLEESVVLRSSVQNVNGQGRRHLLLLPAFLLGVTSQIPSAVAAVKYNKQFKVAAGVVVLVSGALFPTRSLQLSFDKLSPCHYKEYNAELNAIRDEMLLLLEVQQSIFVGMGKEEKREYIDALRQIRMSNLDKTEKANRLALKYFARSTSSPTPSKRHKFCKEFISTLGYDISAIFLISLAYYTYRVSKEEIYDNAAVSGIFSSLVLVTSTYLTGKSIVNMSRNMFNNVWAVLTGKRTRTISEQLRFKTTVILKSLGLITNFLALGPTGVIWGNFYDDFEKEKILFDVTISMAIFLLLATATLEIIDDVVLEVASLSGNEYETEINEIKSEFSRVSNLIEKANVYDLAEYLFDFPAEIRDKLLKRNKLTLENLESLFRPVTVAYIQ